MNSPIVLPEETVTYPVTLETGNRGEELQHLINIQLTYKTTPTPPDSGGAEEPFAQSNPTPHSILRPGTGGWVDGEAGTGTKKGPLVCSGISIDLVSLGFRPADHRPLSQSYSAAAAFVPKLASKVLSYLDPQPTDRILDVGCGDGEFTSNFSTVVAEVYGVDASPSFIQSATQDHGRDNVKFKVVDCRVLERDPDAVNGKWDKV